MFNIKLPANWGTNTTSSRIQNIDVKELSQNPSYFLDKEIIVTGTISYTNGGGCHYDKINSFANDLVFDSNGYRIKIELNRIAMPSEKSKHNFKGIWKKQGDDCYYLSANEVF